MEAKKRSVGRAQVERGGQEQIKQPSTDGRLVRRTLEQREFFDEKASCRRLLGWLGSAKKQPRNTFEAMWRMRRARRRDEYRPSQAAGAWRRESCAWRRDNIGPEWGMDGGSSSSGEYQVQARIWC